MEDDSIDMEDDSIDIEDGHKMTVSIWDVLSLRLQLPTRALEQSTQECAVLAHRRHHVAAQVEFESKV